MEKEAALPKNVRQIGDIQGNRRIYMEDYVMTYIHRKEQQEEQGFLGVFLGEKQETEEGTLLFIRGLVEVPGEDVEEQNRPWMKGQKETWAEEGNTERKDQESRGQRGRYSAGPERSKKQKEAYAANLEEGRSRGKAEDAVFEDSGDAIEKILDTEKISDAEGFPDSLEEPERIPGRRTVLEACREFFGPCEIQGCCVIGEYPVKRMERLAEEIPWSRQFLYHLQEQEETLYWTEAEKYEQISGYFVFYELNREMQEYMAETFGEEESEQDKVPDKAIKNFREKVRKKDQIRLTGMLKLAGSFFVAAVLVVGAVAVNRIGDGRSQNVMVEVPENEAQDQRSTMQDSVVVSSGAGAGQLPDSGEDTEGTSGAAAAGVTAELPETSDSGTGTGQMSLDMTGTAAGSISDTAPVESGTGLDLPDAETMAAAAAIIQNGIGGTSGLSAQNKEDGNAVQSEPDAALPNGTDGTGGQSAQGEAAQDQNKSEENGSELPAQTKTSTENAMESEAAAAAGIVSGGETAEDENGKVTQTSGAGTAQSGEAGAVQTSGAGMAQSGEAGTVQMDGAGAVQTSGGGTAQSSEAGTVQMDRTGAAQTSGNGTAQPGGEEIPEEQEQASVETAARQMNASYVIREGDTLADICQTYYGGIDKLALICEANGIENADMIMPGQKIVLP